MRLPGLPLLVLLAAASSEAATQDLNPLLAGFAIPTALPASAEHALNFNTTIGNVSLDQVAGNEGLQLDAEIQQWSLDYTRPLGHWSLQVTLPWLKVSGGTLDGFIESWHHAFGFPNGNRAGWPRDRLLVQHAMNGRTDFLAQQTTQQLGDISLAIGHALAAGDINQAFLWLTIKLPTGSAARMTGSGATDVALTMRARQQPLSYLGTYQQLSVSALGQGDRLATQQRNHVFSGLLGSDLHFTRHWSGSAQLSAHTAIYDSALRVLGNSLQLSFGPTYQGAHWQSALMISEDIAVDTAPDVQFMFSLSRRL